MFVILLAPSKTLFPMFETLDGIIILAKLIMSWKAESSIVSNPSGNKTLVTKSADLNADFPTLTVSVIAISIKSFGK